MAQSKNLTMRNLGSDSKVTTNELEGLVQAVAPL
jgi:hypothetical protein